MIIEMLPDGTKVCVSDGGFMWLEPPLPLDLSCDLCTSWWCGNDHFDDDGLLDGLCAQCHRGVHE